MKPQGERRREQLRRAHLQRRIIEALVVANDTIEPDGEAFGGLLGHLLRGGERDDHSADGEEPAQEGIGFEAHVEELCDRLARRSKGRIHGALPRLPPLAA